MTSWITYARPFAKRRAIYRKKWKHRIRRANQYRGDDPVQLEFLISHAETSEVAKESIEWMWADFRDEFITPTVTKE